MNIVIIGSAHPLRGGGISTFNERLAQQLQEEGHHVLIHSFYLQYPGFLFPGKSQFTEEPKPENLNIQSSISSINPYNWLKVGRNIRRYKPDLVIVRFWLPFMGASFGSILRLVKKNKHTKIISITDNVVPHEKRVGDTALIKYFLKPIDGFVSMSKEVLKDLKKFEPDKPAFFSPHPVYDNYGEVLLMEDARSKIGVEKEGRYILFFGFIRKYKGLDILLEAMADPRMKEQNIKLIIAGEYYGDKDYYEGIIEQLGIRERLHLYTDFIPNEEVKYYFSAADVIVQPYRTATQSGISQIAYHFEKPMIVTNVGGLPEIVPDGAVGFVTAVDKQAIADAIIRFYAEDRKDAFIQNIKEEKKKYSWTYFTDNIFKLYKTI